MPPDLNRNVVRTVAERLLDVGNLYAAAAQVADSQAIKSRLAGKAEDRRQMSGALLQAAEMPDEDTQASGTPLGVIEQIQLKVDEWIGDDDDAALANVRAADADLVALINDELRNPELAERVRSVLRVVADRLQVGESTKKGLRDMARNLARGTA